MTSCVMLIFPENRPKFWHLVLVNMLSEFSLLELSDSFSFLFFYYNGHASMLIDQLSQSNVTVHKLQ